MLGHEIKEKRLDVQLDLRAEANQLVGDPTRLRQVFCNLIENAVKFTPTGGVVTIRTSNHEAPLDGDDEDHHSNNNNEHPAAETERKTRWGEMIQIEITDTGIGIESHVVPRLFRTFEQGDASITARFGGLGLGLAIAQYASPLSSCFLTAQYSSWRVRESEISHHDRVLVQMHRGKLAAFSAGKDKGATFTVQLPVTPHRPSSSSTVVTTASSPTKMAAIDSDELADQLAALSLRVSLLRPFLHVSTYACACGCAPCDLSPRQLTHVQSPIDR
jgi:hypothetical protein